MGRTGWPFAAQMHGVTPDLLTIAKGLAGGFPAGALLASDELAEVRASTATSAPPSAAGRSPAP